MLKKRIVGTLIALLVPTLAVLAWAILSKTGNGHITTSSAETVNLTAVVKESTGEEGSATFIDANTFSWTWDSIDGPGQVIRFDLSFTAPGSNVGTVYLDEPVLAPTTNVMARSTPDRVCGRAFAPGASLVVPLRLEAKAGISQGLSEDVVVTIPVLATAPTCP